MADAPQAGVLTTDQVYGPSKDRVFTTDQLFGPPPKSLPQRVLDIGEEIPSTVASAFKATVDSADGGSFKENFAKQQAEAANRRENPTHDPDFWKNQTMNVWESVRQRIAHPVDYEIGGVKALVGGAQELGRTASDGIAALIGTIADAAGVKQPAGLQGASFEQRMQYNHDRGQAADHLKTAFDQLNMAPENRAQEAATKLLGIIPNGVDYMGDNVYDSTGMAIFGSGAKAGGTLLTLEPRIAGKMLEGAAVKGKPMQFQFDHTAAMYPDLARQLADHVGQADPELGAKLEAQVDKAQGATTAEKEQMARDATEAQVKALTGRTQFIQGADAGPRPKPPGPPVEDADFSFRPTNNRLPAAADRPRAATPGLPAMPERPRLPGLPALKGDTGEVQTASDRGTPPVPDNVRYPATQARPTISSEAASALFASKAAQVSEAILDTGAAKANGSLKEPRSFTMYAGIPLDADYWKRAGEMWKETPGVKQAIAGLSEGYDSLIAKTVMPEFRSVETRETGNLLARGTFNQMHSMAKYWEAGKARRAYFIRGGQDMHLDFIDRYERNRPQANPTLQSYADAYRKWTDELFRRDQKDGIRYQPQDHYFPRMFKNKPNKDGLSPRDWLNQKYQGKWGDPSFMKEREFTLLKQALDAGFELEDTNPEVMMQARQHASDMAHMRVNVLKAMEQYGLAIKVPPGFDGEPPRGFTADSFRSPNGTRYFVEERSNHLLHVAWDTEGLWGGLKEKQGIAGQAYRGAMAVKNGLVGVTLAWPAFHASHVAFIDLAAAITRNAAELAATGGNKPRAIMKLLATPAGLYDTLWSSPKFGGPVLKFYQGKLEYSKLDPLQKKAIGFMAEAGFIPSRPKEEMLASIQKWKDNVAKDGMVLGTVKPTNVPHVLGTVMQLVGHPIFSLWIPQLKIAAFLRDAEALLRSRPDLEGDARARRVELRRIARNTESRYGEINYQTMFMNKSIKDIAQLSMLSFGWNYGLVEQYAGGTLDLAKAVVNPSKARSNPNNLSRPFMMIVYTTGALALGGVMTKMLSGDDPKTWEDYVWPRTGRKTRDGKDERIQTMQFTREWGALIKHSQQQGFIAGAKEFVEGKGSGIIEKAQAAIQGVNRIGQEIRKPDDPIYKQIAETMGYMFRDIEPIASQSLRKSGEQGYDPKMVALSAAGFSAAGGYVYDSPTEGKIKSAYREYVQAKGTPFEKVEFNKDLKVLEQEKRDNDPKYAEHEKAFMKKNDLSAEDMAKYRGRWTEKNFDLSKYYFGRLDWEQQRKLLDGMSDEERKRFLPASNKKHLRNKYQPPAVRERVNEDNEA